MITSKFQQYDFSRIVQTPQQTPDSTNHFILVFKAVPSELENEIISGDAIKVQVLAYEDIPERLQNWTYRENLRPFADAPLLMASLKMDGDPEEWNIAFPLQRCGELNTCHEFALVFDGVFWQIFCDGKLMDQEYPVGATSVRGSGLACSPKLSDVRFSGDTALISRQEKTITQNVPLQFYTPPGYNTWVGDVVTYCFQGRFYIFYLHDRRHHGSRRGTGAHHFAMMTSEDLINWTDHGAVFELDEQWQTVGTGNAFEFDGKLHLSFGWHTGRYKKDEECASSLIRRNVEELGHTGIVRREDLKGLFPRGGSYAVSEDGFHFRKSEILIHYLENPSIFVQEDGSLHLYQQACWKSDQLGNWKCFDSSFPPSFRESFARNCLDCPTIFKLGNWEYFQVGFTGFWGRPQGENASWCDFVERGWAPYDGANVPMAAVSNGRLIEGSWLNGKYWASYLMMREIIPLADGRVGKKWLPEALPEFPPLRSCGRETELKPDGFTLLELDVTPGSTVKILFSGEGTACEFHLNTSTRRASWLAVGREEPPSYREIMAADPDHRSYVEYEDTHWSSRDYTIEQLTGLDKTVRLQLLVCRALKNDATVIDVEIGGIHTMATNRVDLLADRAELLVPGNMQAAYKPVHWQID